MLQKNPEIVRHAVWNAFKNRLRDPMMKRLKIYVGAEHKRAQQLKQLDI